jgi:hypothetical protein
VRNIGQDCIFGKQGKIILNFINNYIVLFSCVAHVPSFVNFFFKEKKFIFAKLILGII